MFSRSNPFLLLCADIFVQHLDMELSEKEVEKIVSGTRAKTTLTVLTKHLCHAVLIPFFVIM